MAGRINPAFILATGIVLTVVLIAVFAQVPYYAANNTEAVGIQKVTVNLDGITPYSTTTDRPSGGFGNLLSYLAYSWYTSAPPSGTTISSFSLGLSGISATGTYVKAAAGALLNTANVSVQLYSKPYNNSAYTLAGSNSWTDVALPFSQSWTSPYYPLSPLNQTTMVPITITNGQTAAAPSPFQQLISVNPSLYTSLEASNLGNLRFYYPNGTELYAWLESYTGQPSGGNANQATNATIWVKLHGIPANSQVVIDMEFLPTSSNFDGNYWGEAPQLSPSYGQYDNGPKVFDYYQNFNGTSLPSSFGYSLDAGSKGSGTLTVNNGVTITTYTGGSAYSLFYQNFNNSFHVSNTVWEMFGTIETYAGSTSINRLGWIDSANPTSYYGADWQSDNGYILASSTTVYSSTTHAVWSIYWPNPYSVSMTAWGNYTEYTGQAEDSWFPNASWGVLVMNGQTAGPFYWTRVRAAPPGGVMPTAVVGSDGSPQQYNFKIVLTVSGVNAITGAPMNFTATTTAFTDLYWQGAIFRDDVLSTGGTMQPSFSLPMFAIYILLLLWAGLAIVIWHDRRDED